ncbi:cell wall-binding repeat-containing protein [Clostridium sp. CF012]|uniref:cell wall-binding repeat-containing protein n=1 Tax=Clostridium sp. CF012 TaxID=2843319 RepID=UPI001C0C45F8|nr:cell wall-binding repeat-containing protein [Clostridium sp. CF012]MBU3143482.1 cell wall-binding repeat-containing protein [Clostridium sp. CF012]
MFKKTKSSLAITLSVAMLATMVTIPSVASAATGTQISGKDRYETALKIVQDGWDKSESAVIARGDDLADALAAAPLAYAKGKAPILLTKTNEIPAGVLQELKDLGVKNVYIVGGVGAVTKNVANQLANAGLTITRVEGKNRFETSLAVAKEAFGSAPAEVVIANGLAYADALSVSSIAASKGMPILLVDNSKLTAEQSAYIAGKTVYAVGGEGVLNADVVSVSKAVRLAGADRYSTNAAVLEKFAFDYSKLYLAKGTPANLVDSLAGSALAAKTNSPIVLVDGNNKVNSNLATVLIDKIKDDSKIVRLGGTVSQAAADAVEAFKTAVNPGVVKVSSVSAISAKSFKVVFNKAVADTTKTVFTVKRGTTPIVMPATWNAAGTEATLAYTANLAEDSYTVNVMNGTTDLGTSTVAITKQKVTKINVIGDTLGVAPTSTSTSGTAIIMNKQEGFISYEVLDQYGVNITDESLASSITWSSSIGEVVGKKGLVTVTSYTNTVPLTQYTQTILTAINTDSNVSTSVNLKVSLSQGTLSDIKLNALTNVDKKVFTNGDTFNKFYIDYTALDVSGNATKNFKLVDKGILDSDSVNGGTQIYSSDPTHVRATIVADPTDSNKAVIAVESVSLDSIYRDTPIILTAMTRVGKSSSITINLKKAAALDKLNISLPSQEIAIGDKNVVIPFEAFDQDGNVMTKYSDIVDSDIVTSWGGLAKSKNADGTLKLTIPVVTEAMHIYQVQTKTGSHSMITVKAVAEAKAEKLTIVAKEVKRYMQIGAVKEIDFIDELLVEDQYGRKIDLSNGSNGYSVQATTSGSIGVTGEASDGKKIKVEALAVGTHSVTFSLSKDGKDTGITKSMEFSAVADKDIVGFESDTVDLMYATKTGGYTQDVPEIFGKLSNSALVALKASGINKAYSTDNGQFTVTTAGAISANELAAGVAEGNGKLVTIVKVNGTATSVTTILKSSNAAPAAASVGVSVKKIATGLSVDGDTIIATVDAMNALRNTSLEQDASDTRKVQFYAKDQYGKKVQRLSYMDVVNSTKIGTGTAVVDKYKIEAGVLQFTDTAVVNDTFDITVSSANGIMKTMKVIVVANQ